MMTFHRTQIEVQKDALINNRQVESNLSLDSHPDAAILRIDTFGFSTNNMTYALLGERFGYWGFFPASEGYGIVPVWGFATVVASNSDKLTIGERVYGYLPMATHLQIHASDITDYGFSDKHPQRKSISPVYDYYIRCANDISYSSSLETWIANFRPLYTTSFVLGYSVQERAQKQDITIVLTSASSKTAYGTAHILKALMPSATIIGLTSSHQESFVNSIMCYDQVFSYENASNAGIDNETWILDFAGDQARLGALRKEQSDANERTLLIGATDIEAQASRDNKPVGHVFFAPDEVRRLTKTWGSSEFQQRYAMHWQKFVEHFNQFLTDEKHVGAQEIVKQFHLFLTGAVDPTVMHMMEF